jgi:hypothetical protein
MTLVRHSIPPNGPLEHFPAKAFCDRSTDCPPFSANLAPHAMKIKRRKAARKVEQGSSSPLKNPKTEGFLSFGG